MRGARSRAAGLRTARRAGRSGFFAPGSRLGRGGFYRVRDFRSGRGFRGRRVIAGGRGRRMPGRGRGFFGRFRPVMTENTPQLEGDVLVN